MNKCSLLSVSILFAFCVTAPILAAADTCGQLAGVRGDGVEILRVQRGRSAKADSAKGEIAKHELAKHELVRYAMKIAEKSTTPLECDDVILAGKQSSARIILSDAKLSLGSDSRIEMAAHAGSSPETQRVSLLNLTYGKLRALVNRKKDDTTGGTVTKQPDSKDSKSADGSTGKVTFEVKTFSAVAGVRGTDFYVSYDPNAGLTQQATIEGAVEVTQAGTQQKVLVSGGKQVAVETTPQAVKQAQAKLKTGDLPKQLPDMNEVVQPLKVVSLDESTREAVRQTSAAVVEDKDFTTKKAVEALGQPSTWTLKHEPLPDSLKKLKNEY